MILWIILSCPITKNPIDFVHGFVWAILPIKQTLISMKCLHTHWRCDETVFTSFEYVWRHRESRDGVLKGQTSQGDICKSSWSIDFNFDVYLSWEGVYPKIALMWLWRHLMNINEGMNFSHFVLYLSMLGQMVGSFLNFLLQVLQKNGGFS